jgi:hypothetical protein
MEQYRQCSFSAISYGNAIDGGGREALRNGFGYGFFGLEGGEAPLKGIYGQDYFHVSRVYCWVKIRIFLEKDRLFFFFLYLASNRF